MKRSMPSVVYVSVSLLKAIRKGSIPEFITDKFYKWRRDVELLGIRKTREISSYHDEPVKGSTTERRSVRLNQAWRLFYVETETKECHIIAVEEINKHIYR